MALLERVTTLIRANINDLVDKAENPEKLLKQLLLDMQNQFMQVKTQLALAVANQHLLEQKQRENLDAQTDWMRKAELAVSKKDDDLARAALERSVTFESAAANFAEQIADQAHQVQMLRDALHKLEQKMTETRAKSELLIAQHRRARVAARAGASAVDALGHDAAMDRIRNKVNEAEATGVGAASFGDPSLEQRMAALEKTDRIDQLLQGLKARQVEGSEA